jgi:hypothetical protein
LGPDRRSQAGAAPTAPLGRRRRTNSPQSPAGHRFAGRGCYAALRNPAGHDEGERSEIETLEQLAAFSLLACHVDRSEVLAWPTRPDYVTLGIGAFIDHPLLRTAPAFGLHLSQRGLRWC